MTKYTAITFAPVQGFIEKSRKLRDLYGASLILSYLSQQIVKEAAKTTEVISPALIKVQRGMPNRILLKGEFSQQQVKDTMLSAWKELLQECRCWIEEKLPQYEYHWKRDWGYWGNYAWEIFWGEGDIIPKAMEDLENRKLSRGWIAVNWIGESSSLTGTDAIAFPGLGAEDRNPNNRRWKDEDNQIKDFYRRLSCTLENFPQEAEPEGKYLAPNERLSIPELVKRLVTQQDIAERLEMSLLDDSFSDIYRRPETASLASIVLKRLFNYAIKILASLPEANLWESQDLKSFFLAYQILKNYETVQGKGRWTGWFMGDGDKVGDYLKKLAHEQGDEEIKKFSQAMRQWGKDFTRDFPPELGRVVYAGGDDFLGVIYSDKYYPPIQARKALDWLITELPKKWQEHEQDITVSVGFVWAAHSVPQRDILQHCRDAQKQAKSLGRKRVTIRIVFNSGQYIEWTCPWNDLHILKQYCDRNGKTYPKWECSDYDPNQLPNWSHVYNDLAQLKARHAIPTNATENIDESIALALFNIYFTEQGKYLSENRQKIVGKDIPQEVINWIDGLIHVGWHLCSNT